MNPIRNFYRKNFCSRGKRLLLDLIDSNTDMMFGIVLEEVGLPSGHITLYKWWKNERSAFHERICFENINADGISNGIIERDLSEFERVFSCIDAAESLNLKSFSSTYRDGVLYSLSWGSKARLKYIEIDNPTINSPHDHLVENIKNCQWL